MSHIDRVEFLATEHDVLPVAVDPFGSYVVAVEIGQRHIGVATSRAVGRHSGEVGVALDRKMGNHRTGLEVAADDLDVHPTRPPSRNRNLQIAQLPFVLAICRLVLPVGHGHSSSMS